MKTYSTAIFCLCLCLNPATAQEAEFTQGVNISDDTSLSADLFVQGSTTIAANLCVGASCTDDESYDVDVALKIRDARPNIYFRDSSFFATVPTRDWSIEINEEVAFGQDRFSIRDLGSNRRVMTLEGGAPSHSLFMGDTGDIGLGTSIPQADLHIARSASPTIRFDQSGGGSVPQRWELTGNDLAFYLQDVSGSRTPFLVRGNAPSFSLDIRNNGNVGLGTSSPAAPLHVLRQTGAATDMLRLENNEGVVIRMIDGAPNGQEWTFQSNNGLFRIASPALPGPELTMDDAGNLVIRGEITTAGSCSGGCDRVFDASYNLPEMTDHHAMMWELGHLPNVGPTAEDGPMNLSHKVGGMLNELEHAHIYINQLHTQITELQQDQNTANAVIDELRARLKKLEDAQPAQ